MEALDAQKGSYGRNVLKEGISWQVGDGTEIQIWSDLWLPFEFLPYVTSLVAAS